jgi:hypothetical protein
MTAYAFLKATVVLLDKGSNVLGIDYSDASIWFSGFKAFVIVSGLLAALLSLFKNIYNSLLSRKCPMIY